MQRAPELAPLSRDHHAALEVALRMRRATDEDAGEAVVSFAAHHDARGERHFTEEETLIGPHLGGAERERLLREHTELRAAVASLRAATVPAAEEVRAAGELLNAHVRWEERELFPALEARLPAEDLAAIGDLLHHRA